jgi:hypothetical protein
MTLARELADTAGRPQVDKNFIINGGMDVHQRSSSDTGVGVTGYYLADRFEVNMNSAGSQTHEIVTDVPSGYGFSNAYKLYRSGASDSLGPNPTTTNRYIFSQKIEGQNLQHLCKGTSNAKELTLSFWAKFANGTNPSGSIFTVELVDLDNNRQISKTLTSSTSWTNYNVTFPADTTGAFDNDSSASLQVNIWLFAGTNYTSGTLNDSAWASTTDANRVSSSNMYFNSTNSGNGNPVQFFITGMQLEIGSNATDFQFEPFATTLRKCRRYYVRWDRTGPPAAPYVQAVYAGHGQMFSSTQAIVYPIMYEPMRDSPDVGYSATNDFQIVLTGNVTRTTSALAIYNDASHSDETLSYNPIIVITVSSTTSGKYGRFFVSDTTNGFLELDAEL